MQRAPPQGLNLFMMLSLPMSRESFRYNTSGAAILHEKDRLIVAA